MEVPGRGGKGFAAARGHTRDQPRSHALGSHAGSAQPAGSCQGWLCQHRDHLLLPQLPSAGGVLLGSTSSQQPPVPAELWHRAVLPRLSTPQGCGAAATDGRLFFKQLLSRRKESAVLTLPGCHRSSNSFSLQW